MGNEKIVTDNVNEINILNDDILSDEIELDRSIEDNGEKLEYNNIFITKSGEALECEELYEITAKEKTKMIMLIGPVGCGKTTIETSLYQLFHDKPIGGFMFAGSSTIQGYENRSFLTRINSKALIPDTPRTSTQTKRHFLHLRLMKEDIREYRNYLFADLSGELFESHIGVVEDCRKDYPFLDRADYIIGVIDSGLLKDIRKRNSTVESILQLIRTFYDANLISNECVLQIVFSKYDLLNDNQDMNEVIIKIKQKILNRLNTLFNEIEFYNIAAMPKVNSYKIGYGLEELLLSWTNRKSHSITQKKQDNIASLNEFDKLCFKL